MTLKSLHLITIEPPEPAGGGFGFLSTESIIRCKSCIGPKKKYVKKNAQSSVESINLFKITNESGKKKWVNKIPEKQKVNNTPPLGGLGENLRTLFPISRAPQPVAPAAQVVQPGRRRPLPIFNNGQPPPW